MTASKSMKDPAASGAWSIERLQECSFSWNRRLGFPIPCSLTLSQTPDRLCLTDRNSHVHRIGREKAQARRVMAAMAALTLAPLQSLRALGRERRVERSVRDALLGERRKKGEAAQAIGRSGGGRTTQIHALTDAACRPLAILLTGGQVADGKGGALLLERLPDCDILHADKGYDADPLRLQIDAHGATPNIPPKANRKWKNCSRRFSIASAMTAVHRSGCLEGVPQG